MKTIIVLLLIFSAMITSSFAGESKKYGEKITLEDTTQISAIKENPEEFVDKKVLVSGTVVGVCAHRGCWIELSSDKAFQSMRVKVEDGVIVFPMTAKGNTALVEGKVEKIEISREQICEIKEAQAKKKGEEFDPSTVKEGKTIYQIRGLGAVIDE